MRQAWLALVLVSLGCASAPIRKQDAQTLVEADQQVLAGCYDCLLNARETYERFAVAKARPLLINRLFEVQVLIVLREIELALDWQPALGRARALAKELAGAASGAGKDQPPPIDGDRVLALVDMVPPDDYGSPSRAIQAHRRDRSSAVAHLVEDLAWLDASPVASAVPTYLRMSIECSYGTPTTGPPRRVAE